MDARLRQLVRQRAKNCCEYFGLHQEREPLTFHVEHIIARQRGGTDSADDLALACHHCNLHKGTNLAGIDRESGQLTRLFHPRQDKWEAHFYRQGSRIIGLTSIGRVTAALLRMNLDGRLELPEAK